MFPGKFRIIFILLLLTFTGSTGLFAQKSPSSETDLKRQAEKQFSNDDFSSATPLYSQLLSLYPKNPEYNYRYGVCLLLSSHDKAEAVAYLENASRNPKIEEEVFFFLGKSYMITGHYDEALAAFENFKKHAGSGKLKKLDVELLISNCRNAKELSKNRRNVVIINQQQILRNSFYSAFVFDSSSGKMLATPERFLTSLDKNKTQNPTMFLTADGQTIYYASYGKKEEKGKDIYRITKLADGSWGEPENLGSEINTELDEDYPFLNHDGKTLYFSSKGHNSIGGYDIFKSVFDFNTGQWSTPENIGIPINTSDDDFFYVPNFIGDYAQYASSIESDLGKTGVRKIKLGDGVAQVAIISGQYSSLDQPQRRDAKISVFRSKDNGLVTTVRTDPRSGKYELDLPPGEDYTLVVEAGGYLAHAENFSLSEGLNLADLKQKVKLDKATDVERMTLSNYFSIAKQASGEAAATVSSVPSSEVSNEYRIQDGNNKLQPLDIKGRTVYVTPPKNILATKEGTETHALFEQHVSVPQNPQNAKSEADVAKAIKTDELKKDDVASAEPIKHESKEDAADPLKPQDKKELAHLSESKESGKSTPVTNEENAKAGNKVRASKTTPLITDEASEKDATAKSLPDVSPKDKNNTESGSTKEKDVVVENKIPENVSNKELVSIAYEDAQSLRKEAAVVTKDAETEKKLATEQDNLSKSQMKDAQQLLKDGGKENKEKAKQLVKESEDNAKQASIKFKKAKELDAEAKQINSEADESIEEAQLLMKMDSGKTTSAKSKARGTQHAKNTDTGTKENDVVNHGEADLSESSSATIKNPESAFSKKTEEKQTKNIQAISKQGEHSSFTEDKTVGAVKGSKVSAQDKPNDKSGGESYSSASQPGNTSSKTEDNKSGLSVISAKEKSLPATKSPEHLSAPVSGQSVPVVEEKAKQSYLEHQQILDESKQLAVKADELQNKIDDMPASPKRDSLIAKSNELNIQSIKKWQESQVKLSEAKKNDPDVVDKMTEIEKINHVNESDEAVASVEPESVRNPDLQNISGEKSGDVKMPTGRRGNAPLPTVAIHPDQNKDVVKSPEIPVDTLSPVYPEYAETKSDINNKQVETIGAFAEAMKLNKLAQEKKEEEINLRDKAVTLTDSKEKYLQLKKADVLKNESDSLDALSQQKFRTAQKITGEVTALNDKASKLRSKMSPAVQQKQGDVTASVVESKNEPQTNEVVTVPTDQGKKTEVADHSRAKIANKTTSEPVSVVPSKENATITTEKLKSISVSKNDLAENRSKPVVKSKETEVAKRKKTEVPPSSKQGVAVSDKATSETTQPGKKQLPNEKSVADHLEKPVSKETPSTITTETKTDDATKKSSGIEKPVVTERPKEKKLLADATPVAEPANSITLTEPSSASKETIFNIGSKPVYSEANPIPMNPELPTGLVFKVQVGAFHSPLPASAFKNLQPVTGETTRPGWIRYCVGLFRAFEAANLLKSEMKSIGYKDAYVVAYYNGKRIELSEAYSLIRQSGTDAKKLYASNSEKESSLLRSLNIAAYKNNNAKDEDANSFYGTSSVNTKENSGTTEFAVQVGVYKTSKVPSALISLMPLQTEQTKTGLYRFTTGRYNLYASADSSKRVAIQTGVKDAFIVAYKNGNKISLNQVGASLKKADDQNKITQTVTRPVQPAVETDSSASGVVYKVQLGAFRQKLLESAVTNFKKVTSVEITNETSSSGLTIFYAGSFTDRASATSEKNEIVLKGVKDAFVVAFSNGKKIAVSKVVSSSGK